MESLFDSLSLWAAVQGSKENGGKPDPYKAAGIAYGLRGDMSTADLLELGSYLSAEEAFSPDDSSTEDCISDCQQVDAIFDERASMDWSTLSYDEKQRRIAKAQYTEAQQRYWKALWEYHAIERDLLSLDLATLVWKQISADNDSSDYRDPELKTKCRNWLRKQHRIRMDSDGTMHIIPDNKGRRLP